MNPKLSVIIPVYKVEDYLERCVKSVLNQDYRDMEIILVDDGSPDRCPQMCDDLALTDERIVVVHKSNGGLSSARNAGIEIAKGDYLVFLDSDDQWAEGQLSRLMSQIGDADVDMVVFDFIDVHEGGILKKRHEGDFYANEFVVYDKLDYYKKIISHGGLREAAYTKLFPRKFIVDNQLLFCLGITGEDTEWMFRLLRVARKIAVSNVALYLFTYGRIGSIQNSIKAKNIHDIINTIAKSEAYCGAQPDASTNKYELEHCSYLVANAIGLVLHIKDKQQQKELLTLLESKSYLLKHAYASNPKTKKVRMVYKLFGFRFLVLFLKLFMYLKKKNVIYNGETVGR